MDGTGIRDLLRPAFLELIGLKACFGMDDLPRDPHDPPRDYQSRAVDAVFDYFNARHAGHPPIVMPTGTGKSLVIAALIQRILADYPTTAGADAHPSSRN